MITRPEESYRLWRVVVYDLETSRIGAPFIYDISNLRVNIYVSLMYKLKKIGKVFTSKFVGTGPSSYEKSIYRAAVSQRLRNTNLCYSQ